MSKIVYLDTETTSLRADRRAWEIGLIEPDGTGHQWWFTAREDLDLGNADLFSLKIGRFHERFPRGTATVMCPGRCFTSPHAHRERDVLLRVEELTRGAHLVGAVPSFDAEVLGNRMRANGICPSFHYHLIDVETLAAGYLGAMAQVCERRGPGEIPGAERAAELRALIALPWKSDDLAAYFGCEVSEEDRHTALGDARMVKALYEAITGGTQ